MGFGSYDESEQENQSLDTDDDELEAVDVHGDAHVGAVSDDTDASTGELVDQLQDIKGDD